MIQLSGPEFVRAHLARDLMAIDIWPAAADRAQGALLQGGGGGGFPARASYVGERRRGWRLARLDAGEGSGRIRPEGGRSG